MKFSAAEAFGTEPKIELAVTQTFLSSLEKTWTIFLKQTYFYKCFELNNFIFIPQTWART